MDPIIAANWKMHKTGREVEEFFNELIPHIQGTIWIAPSATALRLASEKAKGSNVVIGAQNIYFEKEGAFTGEISAAQVADCGAQFVIIGHSERRRLFGETDLMIKKKIKSAVDYNLRPLLCIGETLDERKAKKTSDVLTRQLTDVLEEDFNGVIAYEPVWAIGTGQSATPEMIEEAHSLIKDILKKLCKKGSDIPLLYGGSVTAETAPILSRTQNVDGALVGGASLEARSLLSIMKGFA